LLDLTQEKIMSWNRKNFPKWDGGAKGQKHYQIIDRSNQICIAKRTLFNNSGWCEVYTNKEVLPTGWKAI
jgi:hypothetical protein